MTDDTTVDLMKAMQSCRCCLLRPPDKGLTTIYTHLDRTEIYSDMLKECLDIHLALGDDECGICETCVVRLRDASEFKCQVQRSQALLERALHVKDNKPRIKVERLTSLDADEGAPICEAENKGEFKIAQVKDITPSQQSSGPEAAPHACQTCSETFTDEPALTTHMRVHAKQEVHEQEIRTDIVPEDIYKCDICEALFTKKDCIAKHIQEDHGEKKYPCPVCQRIFKQRNVLNLHIETHMGSERRRYLCDICTMQFNHQYTLTKHIQRVHEGKRRYFPCDVCGKQLSTPSSLKHHKRIHTGEKAYPNNRPRPKMKPTYCEVCGKEFRHRASFAVHMKIHSGVRHTCDICKEKFTQKKSLKEHMHIHTGEKPFACEICDKRFGLKAAVKNHMIVHKLEKEHACEMCHKKFRHKSGLVAHVKLIHSGQKPFSCNLCDKSFALISLLKRHNMSHTGERPFVCHTCGKSFILKFQLKKHLVAHEKYPLPL